MHRRLINWLELEVEGSLIASMYRTRKPSWRKGKRATAHAKIYRVPGIWTLQVTIASECWGNLTEHSGVRPEDNLRVAVVQKHDPTLGWNRPQVDRRRLGHIRLD